MGRGSGRSYCIARVNNRFRVIPRAIIRPEWWFSLTTVHARLVGLRTRKVLLSSPVILCSTPHAPVAHHHRVSLNLTSHSVSINLILEIYDEIHDLLIPWRNSSTSSKAVIFDAPSFIILPSHRHRSSRDPLPRHQNKQAKQVYFRIDSACCS